MTYASMRISLFAHILLHDSLVTLLSQDNLLVFFLSHDSFVLDAFIDLFVEFS